LSDSTGHPRPLAVGESGTPEVGGADKVIMLETFIVYHLFQNCQGILCGNLRDQEFSPGRKKSCRKGGWLAYDGPIIS
jgi:hypothetical protein